MSYDYQTMRPQLFTEEGVTTLLKIRGNVLHALSVAGAVMADKAFKGVTGDSWLMLAALDHMVERGELREVSPKYGRYCGQHRVFIRGGEHR